MGMFSWLKADDTDNQINIVEGDIVKLLIPEKFGGGSIEGEYDGYGCLTTPGGTTYDVYEVVAFFNEEAIANPHIQHSWEFNPTENDYTLHYGDKKPSIPSESEYTRHNRELGIDIACYDEQQAKLEFPIKLVSRRYNGTYEDCKDFSYSDPDQGFERKYKY